jgi:hypothetical protein
MNRSEVTTVESLCNIAGVQYGVLFGPKRIINFVEKGGHRKIPVPGTQRGALYIDLSLIPKLDSGKEWAREILITLAVDLNCYEAGESLSPVRLVDSRRNGIYTRPAQSVADKE